MLVGMADYFTKKVFLVILLAVASFFAFYNLGQSSLANWDEGIYVNIVAEMNRAPHLLATSNFQPWLDKPVFGFWLHLLGTNIFGLNNFGLRFVGALLFVGSTLLLYLIIKKFYSYQIAFFVSLAFSICPLFYVTHMIRTGDFEVYFLFFTLLTFWVYIISWNKPKLFWLVGLISGLNFMVRGHIALLVLLAIGLHVLWTKKHYQIGSKTIGFSLFAFLLVILPWHIIAYIVYPKEFVNNYLNYSFFQRVIRPIEGHVGNQWFYYNFIFYKLQLFTVLFLVGFLYYFGKLIKCGKEEDKLWLLWLFAFIVPLQFMGTKIIWYVMGVIPAFFCLMASGVDALFNHIINKNKTIIIFLLIMASVAYYGFSLKGALEYVLYPLVLPVDILVKYIDDRTIIPNAVMVYSTNDTFNGPAADFQWKKMNNYNILKPENDSTLSSYIKEADGDNIFLTDLEGFKKIKSIDVNNQWRSQALKYFHDSWGYSGVPIIMEKQ